jgi:hypothetical protein
MQFGCWKMHAPYSSYLSIHGFNHLPTAGKEKRCLIDQGLLSNSGNGLPLEESCEMSMLGWMNL